MAVQVMPVFFFVGGFSNLVTYEAFKRRGEPTSAFVRTRLERLLLRPVFIGLSALVLAGIVAHVGRFERPRPRSAPA